MIASAPLCTNGLERLERQLALLPRFSLVGGETPLQELPRLSRSLGRKIFVKRDDLTRLTFGGNKARQAEFFVGEALARGADTLIAGGNVAQSNHARVSAAAARAAGLDPVILLRPGRGHPRGDYRGNALVTRLLAGDIRILDALRDAPSDDRRAELEFRREIFESVATELRHRGLSPYVVPGSSTALGVMGYAAAAVELYRQSRRYDVSFSKVFVTSLGATHAGLELGARLLGEQYQIVAFAYQPVDRDRAHDTVRQLIDEGAELLGLQPPPTTDICTDTDEAGSRYAASTARSRDALRLAATSDALFLDPTYTAKGFAGMLRWIAEGRVGQNESVLFIHSGGVPGLFAQSWSELSRL